MKPKFQYVQQDFSFLDSQIISFLPDLFKVEKDLNKKILITFFNQNAPSLDLSMFLSFQVLFPLFKQHHKEIEDQAEKAKIEEAKRTFGEYKLKMDPNYEVPEHEQVNLIKKRQQMILLEGSIHKLKVDFNTKINELKIRKKDIILTVE